MTEYFKKLAKSMKHLFASNVILPFEINHHDLLYHKWAEALDFLACTYYTLQSYVHGGIS
jgi:hypothetical protein